MVYRPTEEFEQLLTDLADGELTDEQNARLAELLRGDAEARAYYLDYMAMQTSLRWEYASAAGGEEADAAAPFAVAGHVGGERDAGVVGRIRPRRTLWRYAMVAALAVLVTLVGSALWTGDAHRRDAGAGTVATLTEAEDAQWDHSVSMAPGQRVATGALSLRSGKAVVRFDSGAVLTVAGPAEMSIESDKLVRLESGAVSVYAPEEAVGFTLRTPSSDFVDLGTEFGVVVGEDRASEVHVFDGVVIARPTESNVVVPVLRNEAGRVELERGDIVSVATDVKRFPWIAARLTQSKLEHDAATADAPRYEPLPAGSRVVFLGDRTTDRETHLMLIEQALRNAVDGEPIRIINAGVAFPIEFTDAELERHVLSHRPTHAVIEFGSEIALQSDARRFTAEKFADRVTHLADRLVSAGVEPIIATAYPLTERNPESMALVERYNAFLRRFAAERGYRVADVAGRYYNADVEVHLLLGSADTIPWFEGHREIAIAELAALGYGDVEVEQSLNLSLLPGAVTDWMIRVKPADQLLSDEAAAMLHPDETWTPLMLPQDDPFSRRAAYRSHTITYRDRARGFATHLFTGDDKLVEAVATVDADAPRNAWLNVGAGVQRVWLNGERLFDNERWMGWHAGKERIAVRLKQGGNTIVIESGDSFFVSITDTRDWPLTPGRATAGAR